MYIINVQIVRFIDASKPGWVECVLLDTSAREWLLTDKVPVVSMVDLDEKSDYPQPGVVGCEIIREWTDKSGRQRCVVSTERPWGVQAKDGETEFEVFRDQLTELLD